MARRLRSSLFQVLDAVPRAIPTRPREGARDGAPPSPPSPADPPSPPSPAAPPRPWETYTGGIRGPLPRTWYWRRKLPKWHDDQIGDVSVRSCPPSTPEVAKDGPFSIDQEILWPPMVIVMSTFLEKGEDDKMKSTQKLRETMEENIFVRSKEREKHLEYEQEMKYLEEFFHSQIEDIHKARKDKEKLFKKLLQEERSKARCSVESGTAEDRKLRKEHVQKFIDCQVKDVAEFEAERDELINIHEEKKMKLKKEYIEKELGLKTELEAVLRGMNQGEQDELIKVHEEKKMKLKKEYMDKELELERELDAALTCLLEKHKPDTFEASSL